MSEYEKLRRAQRRFEAEAAFYVHAAIFAVVLALLFTLNYRDDGDWWVQWVAIGWGLGILAHALAVFGSTPQSLANWQLRRIRALKMQL
jgi:hypothetical protein